MSAQGKSVPIHDRSSIGEARRVAMQAAGTLGFDEEQRSDLGIVATEVANNMLVHGKDGELLICPAVDAQGKAFAIDLLALDKGRGMADVQRAQRDGFSTQGTAGQGLGAVQRQSHQSEIYSMPGSGTVVWSRHLLHPNAPLPLTAATSGAVNLALRSEQESGDSFLVLPGATSTLYMVVDGLGHGAAARRAATAAVAVVRELAHETPSEIVARAHDALRSTRGAAFSVAVYNPDAATVTYSGVGNITSLLTLGTDTRTMVSQNGTLGAVLPRVLQEYTYPCPPGSTLLMFSDGLHSRCGLNGYPGLAVRHPQLIAGVLYRDFTRHRDDATILVARPGGRPA